MPAIRRLPDTERRAVRTGAVNFVKFVALAIAAWVGPHSFWPDDWTFVEFDRVLRWSAIATLILGGLALWSAGWLVLCIVRWRQALRWEQMLRDPARAHLVPPLERHVATVRFDRSVARAALWFVMLLLGGTAAVVYALLALGGVVPRPSWTGEDRTTTLLIGGLIAWVLAWRAALSLRRRWTARSVERLSKDAALVGSSGRMADVEPERASAIPQLDFRYGSMGTRTRRHTRAGNRGRDGNDDGALHIMYFRLFDNVTGTERFLRSHWRRVGYVHLLRSADQVDDAELEAAKDSGSVASMFIADADQLDEALARQATGRIDAPMPETGVLRRLKWARDPDRGMFPVRALLCHGSYWQTAVDLLLDRMDYVVIDLTGYLPTHSGTRFELQRTFDRFPVERVVLLADAASDRPFLEAQVRLAWSQLSAASPNIGTGTRTVVASLAGSTRPG